VSRLGAAEVSTPIGREPSASVRGIAADLAIVATPSGLDPNNERTEGPRVLEIPARRGAARDRNHEWVERQLMLAPQLTEERWEKIAGIIQRQITCARDGSNAPPFFDA